MIALLEIVDEMVRALAPDILLNKSMSGHLINTLKLFYNA